MRITRVDPEVVVPELADTLTDQFAALVMAECRRIALKPSAISDAISHVINLRKWPVFIRTFRTYFQVVFRVCHAAHLWVSALKQV